MISHIICYLENANLNDNEIPLSIKWPKSRTLTIPNFGEDVEQQEASYFASGKAKQYSQFGRYFVDFLQN